MENDPLWYKDAIIYEVHVKSFFDSNGDGIGDFKGLTEKLDYLQELGVTALWLLPFFPSPLKDDGYDIADYKDVHPSYGTLHDFKTFLKEAHRRNIRVLIELVLNHTSDKHPWFQAARNAPKGSLERNFYVWHDNPDKYSEARIIFKDYEESNWQWDPVARSYYWHRFFYHQPDLNFENPAVRQEIFRVLAFWLDMGVDGFRLDAVPYLYEQEGTNCENLPETHAFLKALRKKIDRRFSSRIFLAEANQWPEDAAHYFGQDDECHAAFHFPIMPRLYMALHLEDRFPIIDIAHQTPPIPEKSQWAMFLRNHDELTLEMITDEERDEMYRAYAPDPQARINLGIRRRLTPLLKNDRRRIELMNCLLFSLMGTPVIYYGDEIGMGDNIYLDDRHGVRTPMQWSDGRNAGFSLANPQQLYLPIITDPEYHYISVNVKVQEKNSSSLLHWIKHLIAVRKRYKAFGRGSIEFLYPKNNKVLAYFRQYENERILVVANLSRSMQAVELDLKEYQGQKLTDLFSDQPLPCITEKPYLLTLSPHGFLWLQLQPLSAQAPTHKELPLIQGRNDWGVEFSKEVRFKIEQLLVFYLPTRPWYIDYKKRIDRIKILSDFVIRNPSNTSYHLLVLNVHYHADDSSTYMLPVSLAEKERASQLRMSGSPLLCRWKGRSMAEKEGVLFDASEEKGLFEAYFSILQTKNILASSGQIKCFYSKMSSFAEKEDTRFTFCTDCDRQSLHMGPHFLHFFHKLEVPANPEVEMMHFLSEKTDFPYIFPLQGALVYHHPHFGATSFLEVLHGKPFTYPLAKEVQEKLQGFAEPLSLPKISLLPSHLLHKSRNFLEGIHEPFSAYEMAGKRLGLLHLELASAQDDPHFHPEPFSLFYQRSLYQTMRKQIFHTLTLLKEAKALFSSDTQEKIEQLLSSEKKILESLRPLITSKLPGMRQRVHGQCTLDTVLYNGKDVYFSDFRGDLSGSIAERRAKCSALRDVASFVASLQLAGEKQGTVSARTWCHAAGLKFLQAYMHEVANSSLTPQDLTVVDFLYHVCHIDALCRQTQSALRSHDLLTAEACVTGLAADTKGLA